MITGRGVDELYDVNVDPGELHDVYFDNLETAVCLRALLDVQLIRPPLGASAGEGVELTEDDVRTLKSLGYIR